MGSITAGAWRLTASVAVAEVGEPPDVSESDGVPDTGQ